MTTLNFAGILVHQLICNVDSLIAIYRPLSQKLRSLLADNSSTPFLFPF